jgi:endoglucanase
LNGVESDTLHFANTHSWDKWFTYSYTPLLRAGPNRIRLTTLTGRGGPNVDRLESELTARTVEYQAEDATISRGVVESRHPGFTGRGYVNTANVVGGYVEWTVTVDSDGFYNISWVFANATRQDRTTTLTINGVVVNEEWFFRSVSGSWSAWLEAGATMRLAAGVNRIRLTANTPDGGPNYDALLLDLRL